LNTQFLKGIVAAELRSGDKFWLTVLLSSFLNSAMKELMPKLS